jgi:CubicO group peptidase (beta-lactamase class C family)
MKEPIMTQTILFLAIVAATAGSTQAEPDPLASRVDEVIDHAIGRQIVGCVVLVARDGTIVYQRAAGFADREARTPMRKDEIFLLASLSKPIVSAAALALVDKGLIALADPVTKWLPEFTPRLTDGSTPVITIRELLSHTAGLGYSFDEPAGGPYYRAGVSDGLDQPGMRFAENLRRLVSVPLYYPPGKGWRYSLATDVLGEVIAKASAKTLPDAVREFVTGPLQMNDTDFRVRDRSRLATPYADGTPEPVRMADAQVVPFGQGAGIRFAPARIFAPASYPSGGAGMAGTAADFLTFLEALRNSGGRILKPETARQMESSQTSELMIDARGPGWSFGFGFAVLTDRRLARRRQSNGSFEWGGAYGHSWFVDPTERLTVVALTNTAVAGMAGPFPDAIRDAVYGVTSER